MTDRLSLPLRYRRMVEELLREHVPDAEVWAYGSRVNGESHEGSDLDLVVRGPGLEPLGVEFIDLVEAFHESNIPILVQPHDWVKLPESFHREIERDYVVVQRGHPSNDGWLYSPTFPTHWQRMPLHSMAEWVNGLAFRNIQFSPTGMPVIKIAEIKNGISGQTRFTEQLFDESVRLRPGDLLFSWSGQPETSIDAFWWNGPEGWLNQHIYRVTPQPYVDTSFFFYLLRYLKPNFVGIASNKQTTGLGHVTKSDLEEITAALPPLPEQRAIAHVLGTLDDKIELNRRMNETLEAMARALFKSWFVDFEPVRAKMEGRWHRCESLPGLPAEHYDLFPDRLVDSELGETPEGWEVGVLDDAIELLSGGTPKTSISGYWGGNIPWYTAKDAPGGSDVFVTGTERSVTRLGVENSATRILDAHTTIITARGTVGRLACLGVPMAMNQTCYGIRGAHGYPDFFTYWNVRTAVDELQTRAHGTIFDTITRQTFALVEMPLPPISLTAEFEKMIEPVMALILNNLKESRPLAAQRDALLPKLVSGEVRVGDRLVGGAA